MCQAYVANLQRCRAGIPAWPSPSEPTISKIYRRHASYCTRYPGLKNKLDTYRLVTKKDQKVDT